MSSTVAGCVAVKTVIVPGTAPTTQPIAGALTATPPALSGRHRLDVPSYRSAIERFGGSVIVPGSRKRFAADDPVSAFDRIRALVVPIFVSTMIRPSTP